MAKEPFINIPKMLTDQEKALHIRAVKAVRANQNFVQMFPGDIVGLTTTLDSERRDKRELQEKYSRLSEYVADITETFKDVTWTPINIALPPHDPTNKNLSIAVLLISEGREIYQDFYDFDNERWARWSKWGVNFTHWTKLIPGPKSE